MNSLVRVVAVAAAAAAVGWTGAAAARGEVTPEEVLQAVDRMTTEQVQALQTKLEAKLWQPVPEGFFSRLGVTVSSGACELDEVNLSSMAMSSREVEVDEASSAEVALLWRCTEPGLRLGVKFSDWSAWESDLGDGGYSRVALAGNSLALAATYPLVRKPRWQIWEEASVGLGAVALEVLDTPSGGASTIRELDGGFGLAEIGVGIGWRFNPVLSLFAAGSYRFAEDVDLDEGGTDAAVSVDASGYAARIGLGANF